jgi:tetratricopeptide (TPR) repeat protein
LSPLPALFLSFVSLLAGCYDTVVTRPFFLFIALVCLVFRSEGAPPSVVILPFIPGSHGVQDVWISESNAEGIGDILSKNGIFILDRDQRLKTYQALGIQPGVEHTLATSLKVAQELDADFAVLGEFEMQPSPVAATAHLVLRISILDVRKWRRLAGLRVDGMLADLAVLETRAAYLILRAIQPETPMDGEAAFLERFPPVRLDARESFIRGLLAEAEEQRQRYFSQAARLDETYPAPAFQLGVMYWQKQDCRTAATWLRRLPEEFPRALEARFMLGVCEARLGRYREAEAVLRSLYRSAVLPEVANNLAVVLQRLQQPGALELLTWAVDQDPEDPDYRFNLGMALWWQERYEDAAERFREVLELAGEDAEATRMLGRALQGEASRPARAAVANLNRLKEDFNDIHLTQPAQTEASTTP